MDQRIGGVVFNGTTALTGAISGEVYKWQGGSITGSLKNHSRLVDAITVNGNTLYTGGRDNKLVIMDAASYAVQKTFDLSQTCPNSLSPMPRAISVGQDGSLFVGTFGHEIIKINAADGKQIQMMTQGHYGPKKQGLNEAWGLDTSGDGFIHTCSEDGTVRCFDTNTKQMKWWGNLNVDMNGKALAPDTATKDLCSAAQARAVATCPEKDAIALGMMDGTLRIYQSGTLKFCKKVAKEWTECISFSPDQNTLIMSNHDNKFYKFDVS